MKHILIFSLLITVNVALADVQTCEQELAGFPDTPERTTAIENCRQNRATLQALNSNPNNQNSSNVPYNECKSTLALTPSPIVPGISLVAPAKLEICSQSQRPCPPATPTPESVTAGTPQWTGTGIQQTLNPGLEICRGYEGLAAGLSAPLQATEPPTYSQDRKIFCVRKSGITADWDSCKSALSMYNSIVVAEAAMQLFQGVQSNRAQGQAQDQYNQRSANGDAQNAAYDAQIATMDNAKQLNQQQAAAYAAAVAALYSKIQSWIKEDKESFLKAAGCSVTPVRTPAGQTAPPATPRVYINKDAVSMTENCGKAADHGYETYKNYIFANRDAKAAFITAAMMFAAKGVMAGIKASQLGSISKKVAEAKKQTENPYDAPTFEYCKVNTLDPKCATPGTVTEGSGLQDGGFGFGEGFGNNAFNPVTDPDTLGGVEPLPLPGDSAIPDASNPFSDDAKAASGILDPAAAASVQPGAAGGGGGGGGAPGLGGGSASLGNETPGMDDSKKENDIKANKADGKYNIAGGGAFQAIKPMKDENPFANLFDGKGGGSLNEDRSIASEIDGQDSGLFSKISKRYGQIQADKRIEAKNLDAE